MAKGIDINKALEMLLSPYPRPGASILGLIDASFEKFLPDSPLDATELAKRFTYDQWKMKLPERVRAPPLGLAVSVEPTELPVSQIKPAQVVPEPAVHVPETPAPPPTRPAPATVAPEPKPVQGTPVVPPTALRIGGGIGPTSPTSAAPAVYPPPPKSQTQPSTPVAKPAPASIAETKSRPLADILGNFMLPTIPDAKPLTLPLPEEPEPEDSEEVILSTGVSESTLSVIDKLRQRRAALADIIDKGAEEEEAKTDTVSARPTSTPRPAATPSPTSLFSSPKEWFEAKAKKIFYFTKFAFRLTPDEKKYREYVTGVGEFAPKNFVLRSAVLEVKVRLMKDESEAIEIFWDWIKRGIIDEEKKVGEVDEI